MSLDEDLSLDNDLNELWPRFKLWR